MPEDLVTVVDRIFDRQGVKLVNTADGNVRELLPGEAPDPNDHVSMHDGAPSFAVRFADEVASDSDVPDDVGLALRRAAGRFYSVLADGSEGDEQGHVEWVMGPTVRGGVVTIELDTDGSGFTPQMIEIMVRILVEELTPTGVPARIFVPPVSSEPRSAWRSSPERDSQWHELASTHVRSSA